MRIWDLSPAYLNRQSLLGEHRELHGMVSVIVNKKKGYSKHPETLRWKDFPWALSMRHRQLVAEMKLRGYTDRSPVDLITNEGQWPSNFIDAPYLQFQILAEKYLDKKEGRIPLPQTVSTLWAQHKYSVMARSIKLYKEIGQAIAKKALSFEEAALVLTKELRVRPKEAGMRNSIEHMWGYISEEALDKSAINNQSLKQSLEEIQRLAQAKEQTYLLHSTALSDLAVWL